MYPLCRCCKCTLASDDFDRADNTDLGENWREVAGDWEIIDEELSVDSADAFVRHLVEHPTGTPEFVVSVKFKAADSGDQARVMLPAWGDNEWMAAEYEVGDECGFMRLIRYDDTGTAIGIEVPVKGLVPDEWHTAVICYFVAEYPELSYHIIKVTTASGEMRWIKIEYDVTGETADADGFTTGLGTGDLTSLMKFNDFRLIRSASEIDPHCPTCLPRNNCVIMEDSFDRADNDSLGCEWEEETGDEDIVSNKMKFVSGGRARMLVPHPDGQYWYMRATIDAGLNDNIYFIADYDPVAGTYVYGRVRTGTNVSGVLEIGDETGAIETLFPVATTDGTYTLCVTPEQVSFGDGTTFVNTGNYTLRGGRYSAVEAQTNVTIDNFSLKIHRNEDFPNCPDCFEGTAECNACEDDLMARAYLITLPPGDWLPFSSPFEPGNSYVVEEGPETDCIGDPDHCGCPGLLGCGGLRCETFILAGAGTTYYIGFTIAIRDDHYWIRVSTGFMSYGSISGGSCWIWEADLGTEPPDCLNLSESLPFVCTDSTIPASTPGDASMDAL